MEKLKHKGTRKLFTKLTALITSLALTVSLLPTTALAAVGGDGSGGVDNTAVAAALYGYHDVNNVSWRIDAYVSTNANGKIDRANDVIGTDALSWVGAVTYDNFLTAGRIVYLSTDRTNELRRGGLTSAKVQEYDESGHPTGSSKWALPNVTKVDKSWGKYFLTDDSPIAHVTTNPLELPTNIETIKDHVKYLSLVQKVIEDHENLTKILSDINDSLGGTDIYTKTRNLVSEQVLEKLKAAREELIAQGKNGDEAINRLLPNSQDPTTKKDNCIVEWCLVLTPVMEWSTMRGYGNRTFWETYIDGELTFVGDPKGNTNVVLGLDAYWTTQYNETTKKMYDTADTKKGILADVINAGFKISVWGGSKNTGKPYKHWDGWDALYKDNGKLYAEAQRGVALVHQAAYDTHSEKVYCGVPVAGYYFSQGNGTFTYKNFAKSIYAADYAKYGGIAVFDNEIDDPGIPVYYYTYDPDKPGEGAKLTTTERDGF